MSKTEERFFVDQRNGNVAVRDRHHPGYDKDYQGLHQSTPDVIFYAHGFKGGLGWTVNDFDVIKAHEVCKHLNTSINSNESLEAYNRECKRVDELTEELNKKKLRIQELEKWIAFH